jgi:ketosteroid isomerase-like protein
MNFPFVLVFSVLLLVTATHVVAQVHPGMTAKDSILAVIAAQEAGWNAGSIERYMEGYARSAETCFISGGSVTLGYDTVMARYKRGYPDKVAMGTLTFSDIAVNPLTSNEALVYGTWALKRERDEPWGKFTLIFRRMPEGWRIVHDHTSLAK